MSRKIKVLYVTMNWLAPSETFLIRDVNSLCRKGIDVEVIGLKPRIKDDAPDLRRKLNASSFSGCSVGFLNYLQGSFLALLSPLITLQFFTICTKEKMSLSHITKTFLILPSCFYVANKVKKESIGLVHLFWGHFPAALGLILKLNKFDGKLSMFLGAYDLTERYKLSNLVSKVSDFQFTHAYANLSILKKFGFDNERFRVIHRGIELNIKRENFQNRNGAVIVSRLIPEKKVEAAIELIDYLRSNGKSLQLTIVGDGPSYEDLRSIVEEKELEGLISFTGYCHPAKVFEYVSSSKFFLYPSQKPGERLPNAIKEAMYLGAIPISEKSPGIEELITQGVDGMIFENFEFDEIFKFLDTMSSKKLDVMRESAMNKIKKSFDVDLCMQEYVDEWGI